MARKSNAAKARSANLQKRNADKSRSASASSAPAPPDDAELAQPPQKKQRTQPPEPPAQDSSVKNGKNASDAKNPGTAASQSQGLQGQTVKATPAPAQGGDSNAAPATGTSAATASTREVANGPFCLYSTNLDFLKKALIPDAKKGTKDYAALFAKIKEFQLKKDRTAQCFINFPTTSSKGYGRFKSPCYGFAEPMGDEPYDVGIAGISKVDALALPSQAGAAKAGIEGTLVLATSDCGVTSVNGDFKMTTVPVWTGAKGEVIYEGNVQFNVKYGLYARKGHGSGTKSGFGFWAIKSMEGDALAEGDVAHLAGRAGVSASLRNLGFDLDFEDEEDERSASPAPFDYKRYRYWFNNFRHSGIPYDEYVSDEEDYF